MRYVLLFWLLAVFIVLLPGRGLSILQERFVQRHAHRLLAEAKTPAAAREAAGPLGAFFTLRDGSWIDRNEVRHSPPLALTHLLIAYHLLRKYHDLSQKGHARKILTSQLAGVG